MEKEGLRTKRPTNIYLPQEVGRTELWLVFEQVSHSKHSRLVVRVVMDTVLLHLLTYYVLSYAPMTD